MDNTLFSERVELLAALQFFYKNNPEKTDLSWQNFFDWADLGLPLAFAIVSGYAEPTESGQELINSTWVRACSLFGIDPNKSYETIADMIAMSEASADDDYDYEFDDE